jgi:RNA polymerase sigma-70 factor, ECF subfamily
MPEVAAHTVTELLLAWRRGESSALDKLVAVAYPELRRLAHRYMRGERSGHTLQTTALVNEVYLRLIDSGRVHWRDRAHFFAVSAQLMRRILVDAARARRSAKRGGGSAPVRIDDAVAIFEARSRDLVALDEALSGLAAIDPQKARLIELRFFGGLSLREVAEVLGITEDAARWSWRLSRAWLARELDRAVRHGD